MPAKRNFYAYLLPDEGRSGVLDSWDECRKIVHGTNARYKKFHSKKEAEEWLGAGARYVVEPKAAGKAPKKDNMPKILQDGIYFDAGTGRGIGVEVRVTDKKGQPLLHHVLSPEKINPHGNLRLKDGATNNLGELTGLAYAIQVAQKLGIKKIFGDSRLVIDYWSKGTINQAAVAVETVAIARKVTQLRKAFEADGGSVEHISGDINPADLGFHQKRY